MYAQIGPIISGCAHSLPMMIVGRFLTGVGVGASSGLVPLYLSEVRNSLCTQRCTREPSCMQLSHECMLRRSASYSEKCNQLLKVISLALVVLLDLPYFHDVCHFHIMCRAVYH